MQNKLHQDVTDWNHKAGRGLTSWRDIVRDRSEKSALYNIKYISAIR